MRNTLIMMMAILLISCGKSNNQVATEEPIAAAEVAAVNFDWVVGNWVRLNDEEGKETFENWAKMSDTEYVGIGFALQNGDTVSQEAMVITQTNGAWELGVSTPDEPEAVVFTNIQLLENEFVFENNEIDFPNKIRYWKEGDKMNATIANAEMEITFEFEKVAQ
jgi:hypothetical protein